MKIVIISGSHRKGSESLRVAEYLSSRVQSLKLAESTVLDLYAQPISFDPDVIWSGQDENFNNHEKVLTEADAVVVVSPEWGGVASPMLKNYLIFSKALYHKPGLAVGVSSSRGGAYPIAELRNANKNNHIVWVPEHVIFRNVESLLIASEPADKDDSYIRDRSDYALGVLAQYATAIKQVRESDVLDRETYPNGM